MDAKSVKTVYNRYAQIYDFFFGKVFAEGRAVAIEIINQILVDGAKVLDVGVGTGLSLPHYKRSLKITGVDISEKMLRIAQKRVAKKKLYHINELLCMDAENLNFPDNSFDSVVAMYVSSVVPNPQKFLSEVERVCRPGGDVIIVNHFASQNFWIGGIEKFFSPLSRFLGFRTHMQESYLLEKTTLKKFRTYKVNIFDQFRVLHLKKNNVLLLS